jgi:hypothetical protein
VPIFHLKINPPEAVSSSYAEMAHARVAFMAAWRAWLGGHPPRIEVTDEADGTISQIRQFVALRLVPQ